MSLDVEYIELYQIFTTVGKQHTEKIIEERKNLTEWNSNCFYQYDFWFHPDKRPIDEHMKGLINAIAPECDQPKIIEECLTALNEFGDDDCSKIIITDDFSSHPLTHTPLLCGKFNDDYSKLTGISHSLPEIEDPSVYDISFHRCITSGNVNRLALYVIDHDIHADKCCWNIHLTEKSNIDVYRKFLCETCGYKIPKSWNIKSIDNAYEFGEEWCSM